MEFKDRGINQQHPPRVPPIYRYFTDKIHGAYSMGPNMVQTHQEFFPYHHYLLHLHPLHNPFRLYLASPNPHDHMREALQIEIEKEKIREEIIISEIARRRVMEAEARRRELMMGSEFAPRTSDDGCSFSSSQQVESISPRRPSHMGARADESFLERKVTVLLNGKQGSHEKQKVNCLGKPDGNISGSKRTAELTPPQVNAGNVPAESERFETLPFISTADLRVSEVKPVSERVHEKPKVNFPGKPDGNISGTKRKASNVLPSGVSEKKPEKEWTCDICQVTTTSEQSLNDHLRGKKHKSKEVAAALTGDKAGKSYSLRLSPKKDITIDAAPENPGPVQKKQEKVHQTNVKSRFWCEMCKVSTFSKEVMSSHEKGKKHVNRLRTSDRNGEIIPVVVNRAEKVIEDGKSITKGDETTTDKVVIPLKLENQELVVDIVKPEK